MKFHDNNSLSIAEILLFIKKDGRKLRSPTLPVNACIMITYALRNRLRDICINKNKMVISREDRMLIKVWHRKKGYGPNKLAEFPNKAFELITKVFTVLETCVFSVRSKR